MKKVPYTEALLELEEIVNQIENDEISVDELSEKVKRAAWLIKSCKETLRTTEEEVALILKEINEAP
ncbi:MAG: exodeoxyribonuclease VII small subunit [Bacteroidetes bacterium]|nr:exodeoxyribonuclease VII small subunit [Bacteroidota bacterium]PIQ26154.1 MAG: exodeoxyribonuclease VII small subunit [Bacteroidetes bacterium CG18_big_fil_WC_8_21_14_2_50_41_14]PJB59246.1 MAG: exodeoxyribonuclease VII small subunit [Bacteroidetes bacterium CG_4_9_14_3_um_filter_41_19]